MGYTPIRNHLDIPYGLRLGDRMSPTTRTLILAIRGLEAGYVDGCITAVQLVRELDALTSLYAQTETILPSTLLPWEEIAEVGQWLPEG